MTRILTTPVVRVVVASSQERDAFVMSLMFKGWQIRSYCNASTMFSLEDWARPGCILLDADGSDESVITTLERLLAEKRELPVVVTSATSSIELAVESMKLGAKDFVRKQAGIERLVSVIDTVLANEQEDVHLQSFRLALQSLSSREREVIELSCLGKSHDEVAGELGISVKTAQVHRYNAYCKLNLHNITEISRLLIRVDE